MILSAYITKDLKCVDLHVLPCSGLSCHYSMNDVTSLRIFSDYLIINDKDIRLFCSFCVSRFASHLKCLKRLYN